MKKILFIVGTILIALTGCNKFDSKDALNKLNNDSKKIEDYYITAQMSIVSNEETYNYDVTINYKEGPYYKVVLSNTNNLHQQIILKNSDGVYVITPNLNKSFKFQSSWPNNSSQSYLPEVLLKDIENDENRVFNCEKDECIFTTKVNYPNNSNLSYQKITYDKEMNIKKVVVYDKDNTEQIVVKILKYDKNTGIKEDFFKLENNIEDQVNPEETTSKLESATYPTYLPVGSTFEKEEIISNDEKERIILTFTGEKAFILVEEMSTVSKEFEVNPSEGDLVFYENILGNLTQSSLSWSIGGKDYYLYGQNLTEEEILKVASSTYLVSNVK